MTVISRRNTHKRKLDSEFAMARRALRGIQTMIDMLVERAHHLEREYARALYKSGRATTHDSREVIAQDILRGRAAADPKQRRNHSRHRLTSRIVKALNLKHPVIR
jgi:hypothetical protein